MGNNKKGRRESKTAPINTFFHVVNGRIVYEPSKNLLESVAVEEAYKPVGNKRAARISTRNRRNHNDSVAATPSKPIPNCSIPLVEVKDGQLPRVKTKGELKELKAGSNIEKSLQGQPQMQVFEIQRPSHVFVVQSADSSNNHTVVGESCLPRQSRSRELLETDSTSVPGSNQGHQPKSTSTKPKVKQARKSNLKSTKPKPSSKPKKSRKRESKVTPVFVSELSDNLEPKKESNDSTPSGKRLLRSHRNQEITCSVSLVDMKDLPAPRVKKQKKVQWAASPRLTRSSPRISNQASLGRGINGDQASDRFRPRKAVNFYEEIDIATSSDSSSDEENISDLSESSTSNESSSGGYDWLVGDGEGQ